MFGQNRLWAPKRFADEPEDTLVVTSIFPTLQGEGPFAGQPAVFVRLTYCNLACSWCDTFFDRGDRMTFAEINAAIDAAKEAFPLAAEWPPMLVITGGEPMMQENLVPFLEQRAWDEMKQIETNGAFYLPLPWNTHLVVSPKINEKTRRPVRIDETVLRRADSLKFVINPDLPGYDTVPEWALQWRDSDARDRRIYLSPMNMYARMPDIPSTADDLKVRTEKERISFWQPGLLDHEANQRNHEHAAWLAMRFSCTLSLQQHLYASLP